MTERPSFYKNWRLLRRFKHTKKRLNNLSLSTDRFARAAQKAEREIIDDQIDRVLAQTLADELKNITLALGFKRSVI